MNKGDTVYAVILSGHLPVKYGTPYQHLGVGVYRVSAVSKSGDSFKVEHVSGFDTYGGFRAYQRMGNVFKATYDEAWNAVQSHLVACVTAAQAHLGKAQKELATFEATR